ncbi:armadillo repeat-containing X-linked protein 1 isoform X3 [Lynx canadensis]|uniref:armadillo repeat-containing X-linked protein 1 isoform X3 n=1 Tax=Lynx canadensis TaxID=61383 RepID=UPI0011B0DE2F|nr:armadillo repeat-containing X-linked protein 1 isoform X3 [Lynx canadensis]
MGEVTGVLHSRVTWPSREQQPTFAHVLLILVLVLSGYQLPIALRAGGPVAREGGGSNRPDPSRALYTTQRKRVKSLLRILGGRCKGLQYPVDFQARKRRKKVPEPVWVYVGRHYPQDIWGKGGSAVSVAAAGPAENSVPNIGAPLRARAISFCPG